MKKVLKLFIIILALPLIVNAKAHENPSYEVTNVYISANLDFIGSMHVEEAIVVKGDINKFTREIDYQDSSLEKWEAKKIDFEKSSFYNGRAMSLKRVLSKDVKKDDINFNILSKFGVFSTDNVDYKEDKTAKKGDTGKYTIKKNDNGEVITIYNPSKTDYTVYYLEYYIDQIAVLHNDVAEVYYKFIPTNYDDIDDLEIQLLAPGFSDKKVFKFWAHGSLKGTISPIGESEESSKNMYRGVLAKLENVKNGADIRMTFDKNLLSLGKSILNDSEENALNKIEKVEDSRSSNSNKSRKLNSTVYLMMLVINIIYIIIAILLIIYTIKEFYKKKKTSTNIDMITSIIYFILGIILIGFSIYFKLSLYIINIISILLAVAYLSITLRLKRN